jgi:hypothetical protein
LNTVFQTSLVVSVATKRDRLRKRGGSGNDVFFRARPAHDEWPEAVASGLEVKEEVDRQGVGIALNVGFDGRRLQVWVAIVVKAIEFRPDISGKIVAEKNASGEAIANAGLRGLAGGINGTAAINTVSDIRSNFILLSEGGDCEQHPEQALHPE